MKNIYNECITYSAFSLTWIPFSPESMGPSVPHAHSLARSYSVHRPGNWETGKHLPQPGRVIILPKSKSIEITLGPVVGFISADSKLPVGMSSSTPSICTVHDQLVTLLQTGSCSISVTQAGNDQYLRADPVNFSFDVIPPVITTANSPTERAWLIQPLRQSILNLFST